MFNFHILYLNVNELISVKGCIVVVQSNSVSTGSCDIVFYWGYGQMDHVWSLLLLLRPWMGLWLYMYVGYSSPNKGDSAQFFVKIWILINGTR